MGIHKQILLNWLTRNICYNSIHTKFYHTTGKIKSFMSLYTMAGAPHDGETLHTRKPLRTPVSLALIHTADGWMTLCCAPVTSHSGSLGVARLSPVASVSGWLRYLCVVFVQSCKYSVLAYHRFFERFAHQPLSALCFADWARHDSLLHLALCGWGIWKKINNIHKPHFKFTHFNKNKNHPIQLVLTLDTNQYCMG